MSDGAFAMKFFQGGFIIFDGSSVYRIDLGTGDLTTEIAVMQHAPILGAGFAMCPPPS
jgi:hypothetical protein